MLQGLFCILSGIIYSNFGNILGSDASFLLHIKVVGHLGALILEGDVVEGAKESLEGLFTFLGFELALPDFDGVPTLCLECQEVFVVTFLVALDLV